MTDSGESREEGRGAVPEEATPIPPETQQGGGRAFMGCLWVAVIVCALMLVLLVIGLLTRVWIVPAVPRY